MSDSNKSTSSEGNGKRTLFWLLSLYMIATFLWRACVPGGEWPRPPTRFITMAIDLLCVVSLILLKVQLSAEGRPGKRISTGGVVMFGLPFWPVWACWLSVCMTTPVGPPGICINRE